MVKKVVKKSVVKKRSVTFTKSKTISTRIATKCKTKKRSAPKRAFKRKCRKIVIRKIALGRTSAFRALASTAQTATTNGIDVQVRYQNEVLDINNEYNPLTSTFRPQQSGVYSLVAAVAFISGEETSVNVFLSIRVNGIEQISDFETFTLGGLIDAAGIIPLNAGDTVQVFALFSAEQERAIFIVPGTFTRFEGARIR
ncbi:complement C1q domain-containing protein [Paenibacillus arenilitoris]|uniref:C1q domain-containing protein n=1 Tax=Paenibacillus arenilitoris TaxID=2772299 RepID=A0A927H4E0_9BACL|nr:hypothetical protein [Paenibacillus arenilitoris]MBD2867378.1 hypothetical protein [Paenibacillus arenilitoris]